MLLLVIQTPALHPNKSLSTTSPQLDHISIRILLEMFFSGTVYLPSY